jgi:hypothetical protein
MIASATRRVSLLLDSPDPACGGNGGYERECEATE